MKMQKGSVLGVISIRRALVLGIAMTLAACGSVDYQDVKPQDRSATVGSAAMRVKFARSWYFDFEHVRGSGEDTQYFSEGVVDVGNVNLVAPVRLNYDFSLQATGLSATFRAVNQPKFLFDISPGLRYVEYEMKVREAMGESGRANFQDDKPAPGVAFTGTFPLSEYFDVSVQAGYYRMFPEEVDFKDGSFKLVFKPSRTVHLHAGYRYLSVFDDDFLDWSSEVDMVVSGVTGGLVVNF